MRRVVSRRDFLKLAGMGLGAMAFDRFGRISLSQQPTLQFPSGERLGRVGVYPDWYFTEIKAKPNGNSATIRKVAEDEVIEWVREVIGSDTVSFEGFLAQGPSKTWVETPEGYLYEPHLQPVRNVPNSPMPAMPEPRKSFLGASPWSQPTMSWWKPGPSSDGGSTGKLRKLSGKGFGAAWPLWRPSARPT